MNGNFYRMYTKHQFAVVKLQSDFLYPEDIESLHKEYNNDPDYTRIQYLIIIIDEKCKPKFSINYISQFSKIYNAEYQVNNHKSIVWVVSQPIITALTHLLVLELNDNSYYCSTLKKAFYLLDSTMDYNTFIELLDATQKVPN
ncbi:hypothetical protein [Plebeiibacterium sediminum]|uniref:Uncharacterized protein n=1 Tax=Plebeiibacterium sediminum TaxID=2992112 RepID=A0AAE3M9L3_9BACT|nr:hypothetical protein [Plebeiobacterium sediminum]MCW3789694.1 hypothetical protein [Plebeiobacterium sediminum]